jgi:glycosyltransferase involved in cell wall biosynthesis
MLPELRTSDAKVLLVGDGPALQGALTLAGDLGVRKRVVSIGRINHDEVPRYVGLFDIAVMPYDLSSVSLYFSPLKLFEYLALGVPIVSVDAGQMRDVLGGSGAAVLLPDASPQAIAVAVDGLLADSRRRASMVARAVALATRYTWEANARAICDVCIEAVHPRDSAIGKGE